MFICINNLHAGYLSSINFYAPCITPTSYNAMIVKYRVSINSFPDYEHLLKKTTVRGIQTYLFSKCNSRNIFYNTSVHFNMCSFCCTIISFSPRVLQHVFSYSSKSVCYSCLQICNIWNWCRKHFVLNIPP